MRCNPINIEMNNEADKKIKQACDFLSSVSSEIYRDVYMLSNQVLSKNPSTNNFLIRYINGSKIERYGISRVLKKLLAYYLSSLRSFLVFLREIVEYRLSKCRFIFSKQQGEIIILDTPFLLSKILDEGKFQDIYFSNLVDLLMKKGVYFTYLPIFIGKKPWLTLTKALQKLKTENVPVLTEYQSINFFDVLKILNFIVVYPLKILNYARPGRGDCYDKLLLKSELIETLHDVTFPAYVRYLTGKKIARLPFKKIKIISWYENQTVNKSFFKGLREKNKKTFIYGAQLLIYSKNVINIAPDENEADLGIIPDKIVVNGPRYVPESTRLNFVAGPSLRSAMLFKTNRGKMKPEYISLILPYYRDEVENILKITGKLEGSGPFLIKLHPIFHPDDFCSRFPKDSVLSTDHMYEVLAKSRMIITGGATGTLVEAVSLGVPAIYLCDPKKINFNPLVEEGKGIIWEDAFGAADLRQKITLLDEAIKNKPDEISRIARRYKEMFFCEPTEEKMMECFDIV